MDELLNLKTAAEFLDVSEKVLMRLLQEEAVPARKIGKEWRFNKQALMQWIAQGDSRNYVRNLQDDNAE